MVRHQLPLTREVYLRTRFEDPSSIDAEAAASVPGFPSVPEPAAQKPASPAEGRVVSLVRDAKGNVTGLKI